MTANEDKTIVPGELGARLTAMARGRETLDLAQLQFISLDEARRAYGPRWPEQHARILETAESHLTRRMQPTDLLVRNNDGFLVVFGSGGAE